RLPPLSPTEQAIWQLSHQINVRGFHIDRAFAEAARKIAEAAAPEIDQEIQEITGGDVTSINQVAKLTAWLQDHGCSLKTLDRKAIQRQLEKGDDELSPIVRRVLELRLGGAQAAATSRNRRLQPGDDLCSAGKCTDRRRLQLDREPCTSVGCQRRMETRFVSTLRCYPRSQG